MAAITFADLKTRVAAVLKQDGIDITDDWDVHIGDAVPAAYNRILSKLVCRGFTKAQVDSWRSLNDYWILIGLYETFIRAAGLHAYDDKWVEKWNRGLELETVCLLDGDGIEIVIVPPVPSAVGYGVIKHHQLDSFTKNDGCRGGAGSFRKV